MPAAPSQTIDLSLFPQELSRIVRTPAFIHGQLEEFVPCFTELARSALRVRSVRVFQLMRDGATLEGLSEAGHTEVSRIRLARAAFPAFFAALEATRVLPVCAPDTDPLTGDGLRQLYFAALDVCACLFVPTFVRGRFVGMLAFEHSGAPRSFSSEELLVAASLGDVLAAAVAAREARRTEDELEATRRRLGDILERRTSSFVRENADLQREVDQLTLSTEQIRRSEDELRLLFAASPVPMLLIRKQDQRVMLANEKAAAAIGCELAALVERPAAELFAHRSDYTDVRTSFDRAGGLESQEVQLTAADGQPFWALVSARGVTFAGHSAILLGFFDLTNQKAVEHQLRFLAQRDPLTQAYNRHHFWQLAGAEMSRVRRYERPLSLAMIDADHFKSINDAHGHDVGDHVLRRIVDISLESLRKSDVLARYGGEELVVLLPETSAASARVVMDRIRERIEKTALSLDDGLEIRVTVSIGIAGLNLEAKENLESLLKRSDEALYLAKRSGRNRVEVG